MNFKGDMITASMTRLARWNLDAVCCPQNPIVGATDGCVDGAVGANEFSTEVNARAFGRIGLRLP
jgi:hypothetical protein